MGGGDDVLRLEDLREWLQPSGDPTVLTRRAVPVAVAVLAVGLTLGVLVHTPGAVNEDAVYEGEPVPAEFENPDVVLRNSVVYWFHRAAAPLLATAAASVALVASLARGNRGTASLAVGGGAGGALGYAAFVVVGHAAFTPTEIGVFVESPPRVRLAALAANAVGVAVAATIAAAVGAMAGSHRQGRGRRGRSRGRRQASEEDATLDGD